MTYETMDWDAEAQRMARAFGVEEECEFVSNFKYLEPDEVSLGETEVYDLKLKHRDDSIHIESFLFKAFFRLAVSYSRKELSFLVVLPQGARYGRIRFLQQDEVTFNGVFSEIFPRADATHTLARALFHLDLLTPEVEEALHVTISAHQKIEWALEYEARNGL